MEEAGLGQGRSKTCCHAHSAGHGKGHSVHYEVPCSVYCIMYDVYGILASKPGCLKGCNKF